MESISFLFSESWDPVKKVVSFYARKEGETIPCRVTFEAMQKIFDASSENVLDAFRPHRRMIETRAAFAIKIGRFEPDGSVKITTDDFVYGYRI